MQEAIVKADTEGFSNAVGQSFENMSEEDTKKLMRREKRKAERLKEIREQNKIVCSECFESVGQLWKVGKDEYKHKDCHGDVLDYYRNLQKRKEGNPLL